MAHLRRALILWVARSTLTLFLAINLQAALAFLLRPEAYVASFELAGTGGRIAVQGFGIFILLWVVPYPAAIWHPLRHLVSFGQALAAQAVGVALESWLYLTLPSGHPALQATGQRFIAVDGLGLLLLAMIFALVFRQRRTGG